MASLGTIGIRKEGLNVHSGIFNSLPIVQCTMHLELAMRVIDNNKEGSGESWDHQN